MRQPGSRGLRRSRPVCLQQPGSRGLRRYQKVIWQQLEGTAEPDEHRPRPAAQVTSGRCLGLAHTGLWSDARS